MGQEENSKWEVLDSNSASDGDVWMAWSLLEAGRLWKEQRYTDIGSALAKTYCAGGSGDGAWAGFHVVAGQSGICRG
ncbi:glycosyl hydrolase family 8 [Escherichia coli]